MLPIRKGLNDPSPYVRKAAVVGCAKLFCLSPESVKGTAVAFPVSVTLAFTAFSA